MSGEPLSGENKLFPPSPDYLTPLTGHLKAGPKCYRSYNLRGLNPHNLHLRFWGSLVVCLTSEQDSSLHFALKGNSAYSIAHYAPRYLSTWLPPQPYTPRYLRLQLEQFARCSLCLSISAFMNMFCPVTALSDSISLWTYINFVATSLHCGRQRVTFVQLSYDHSLTAIISHPCSPNV